MKRPFNFLLPALMLGITALIPSCKKDNCNETVSYRAYEPVYMSYESLRSGVKTEAARALQKPGKIYMAGNFIFVNEVNEGIHIINNQNPASPQNVSFISIPGNIDMAAMGNLLYADSYIDLLVFDISNPQQVQLVKRVENALPQRYTESGIVADPQQGVVVDIKEVIKTEKYNSDCNGGGGGPYPMPWLEGDVMFNGVGGAPVSSTAVASRGKGGSMARFALHQNMLYVVDNTSLRKFDLTTPVNPTNSGNSYIGQSIETIFPYNNHLFIGSANGMFIYNVSNPSAPQYVSTYTHATACDPVAVEGDYAYVTLRSGTPCNTNINQLEVVNIQNLTNPTLSVTVPMTNPHGVGIENGTLFICDGNDGLKVYNANNVQTIAENRIAHYNNIHAYDVIPHNNRLLMIGENGLYQYDYSNTQNIQLLSVIPVQK